MAESYLEIQLDQQPIELCKLLKIADLVTGGGEAKVVISEGYVSLNGEVEYQKRKKIYHNDMIEFNGETIQVIINEDLTENLVDNTLADNTNKEIKKTVSINEDTVKRSKRKPISF